MSAQMYQCWRCGARHYYGSGRGRECAPVIPTLVGALVLVGLGAIALQQGYFTTGGTTAKDAPRTQARVERVVDGDTIRIRTAKGREKSVRILGINTPELARNGKPGECYAAQATKVLQDLLDQAPDRGRVELIGDPTQDNKDVYGRLLRYVEVGGRDVGATLIRRGAARAREDHPPVQRAERYADLEDTAQADDRGLWAACS
ncbi:thermonuclease family protein [Pimelobacter sp. 30-1]|uniref:thermonuclease family protein n=1 Tax=Pimelobacter sp. 30-1 TaxID=2004991 RepID=UPI00207BB1B3|nr:thermonuclease family protein [Pimelobacter sp. 30-1]MBU2698797.1 hypothetical protein [Pimelobacter sp. 30-1]